LEVTEEVVMEVAVLEAADLVVAAVDTEVAKVDTEVAKVDTEEVVMGVVLAASEAVAMGVVSEED
jgi:hypothetical protein